MKRICIIGIAIGMAAAGAGVAAAAGPSYGADHPAGARLQQSAQAEHQNRMREWSMGLGIGLPGASPIRAAGVGTAADAARTGRFCRPAQRQAARHARLAAGTEYQKKLREWESGLGLVLPGVAGEPAIPASDRVLAQNCLR